MRAKSGRWITLFALLISGIFLAGTSAWAGELPTIDSGLPIPNPEEDTPYSHTITVSDPDGGTNFTFGFSNGPDFLTLVKETANSARLHSLEGEPPTSDYLGIIYDNVEITVKDPQGDILVHTFSMELQPRNDAPEIIDGNISLDTATQGVLYAHTFIVSDEENDIVSFIDANSTYPGWLEVSKTNTDPQTFQISGTPDNAVALEPPSSIELELSDPDGGIVRLFYTLEVENVNDAPTITDGDIDQDDIEQDAAYTHTFTVEDIDGDVVTINLDESTLPNWLTPEKTSETPQIFQLSGTPDNEDALSAAPENIVLTLEDGNEGSVALTYELNVINLNDPPTIETGAVPPPQARQGILYTHTFTVKDIDGNDVTEQEGSVTPDWLELDKTSDDPQTFTISGTPDNEVAIGTQPVSFDVILGDNFSETEEATITLPFSITVQNVNDAPEIVIGNQPPTTINQDEEYIHTFTVRDIDGDTVAFKDLQSTLPEWLSVGELAADDQGRQRFEIRGTPDNEVATSPDPINIDIKIGDNVVGDEIFASLTYTLDVQNINDAPVISEGDSPPTTVKQDSQYSHVLVIEDIDGDEVAFKSDSSAKPSFMTVTALGNNKFELKGKPANADVKMAPPYSVNLVFGDNFEENELTVALTYDLTVQNVNDPPTISGTPKVIKAGQYTQENPYVFQPVVDDIDRFGDASTWDINNLVYQIINQPPTAWSRFVKETTDAGKIAKLLLFPSADQVTETTTLSDRQIVVSDGKGGQATLTFPITIIAGDDQLLMGDFNLDFTVNLSDAILGLQTAAGIQPAATLYVQEETDANGDLKLGLQDVIYILDHVATP